MVYNSLRELRCYIVNGDSISQIFLIDECPCFIIVPTISFPRLTGKPHFADGFSFITRLVELDSTRAYSLLASVLIHGHAGSSHKVKSEK